MFILVQEKRTCFNYYLSVKSRLLLFQVLNLTDLFQRADEREIFVFLSEDVTKLTVIVK